MHNYCEYRIDEFDTRQYLWIFLYIRQDFIEFLSYIDCMGIIPTRNDICLVDICTRNTIIMEAKYFWFL